MLAASDWTGVKRTYENGSLQDLATTPAPGTAQYDHFSDFYSSTRWMDDFALMAIDGTGAMTDDGARAEGTEKTVLNALLTHTALTHLHTALNMGAAGNRADHEAVAEWDKGWAYYTGADQSCAPYGTADKRGGNFGTLSDTAGLESTAKANEDIMAAFVTGQGALRAGSYNADTAQAAYNVILQGIQTTYLQASIRYAYKIDVDLASNPPAPTGEHRGEGWGFWRIVEPYIASKDADGAKGITDMYDLSKAVSASSSSAYYYYCLTKNVIMAALPTGVSSADIGVLEGTGSIDCDGVQQSPPVSSSVVASPPPGGVDDCTCSCCNAAQCPSRSVGTFYAGSSSACSEAACRAQFYFCPDSGSHTEGSIVEATYGTGTAGQGYTLGGATYTPVNNVEGDRRVTDETCAIKSSLGNSDWTGTKAAYTTGAADSAATVVLQDLATTPAPGTAQYDHFSDFYSSTRWMDDFALMAIDGTGAMTDDGARAEGTEKTVLNALLTHTALTHLHTALNMGAAGNRADHEAVAEWDKGWAYYTGADQSCAPYGTADKRGGNFGTLSDTAGLESTAKANEDIMAAFVTGQGALRAGSYNANTAQAAYNVILQGIQTTYLQASIRYAYKIDVDLASNPPAPTGEHRGEGWGFWRIVEPYIASKDADGAKGITDMYDLSKAVSASSSSAYYYYCLTKNVIMAALPTGVSSADIGVLEGTGSIDCDGVQQSPPVSSSVVASPPPGGVDDCTCSCCNAAQCPSRSVGTFYAGSSSACSEAACRAQFYFCPDSGSHTEGSIVEATYSTGTAGQGYTLGGATYTPVNNVEGDRRVTDETCAIKSSLGNSDWTGTKAAYTTGAADSAATVVLQDLATTPAPGTAQYDHFSDFYSSTRWMDDFALLAIDGTGAMTDDGARAEGTEKTVLNALLTHTALTHLHTALNMADELLCCRLGVRTSGRVDALHSHERRARRGVGAIWQYWVALQRAYIAERGLPRAEDKRGGNFGTLSDTAGLESTAKANEDIMAAFVTGQGALRAGSYNANTAQAAYNVILQGIQTTYLQASIRYAYKIDVDLASNPPAPTGEHRGEGWGFWRIVEPYIASKDADGAKGITDMYDLSKAVSASSSSAYYYYCLTKNVIMAALPTGVSSADIGVLEGTGSIDCDGVQQSPPVSSSVVASPPPGGVDDCTCSCCNAAQCPSRSVGTFYAGSSSACSEAACRAQFYFCPDSGSHTEGSIVEATYSTGTAGQGYTLGGATYTPVNNVEGDRRVTDETCAIKSSLGNSDWTGTKAAYTTGAADSAATVVLQDLATTPAPGTAQYDHFSDFYSSTRWMDDFALMAIDGTGAMTDDGARAEGTEKTVLNALLTHTALTHLHTALNMGAAGNRADHEAVAEWDKGWAYYTGADQSCAPYGTADKRGGNFGTLSDTAGLESTAKANEDIMAAFVTGQGALRAGSYNADTVQAAYNAILQGIQTTYLQASIRYAYKIDVDLASNPPAPTGEHRGEGWGFWRIVEPYIASKDADGAQDITDMYNLAYQVKGDDQYHEYYYYCMTKTIIMDALPDFLISSDIGNLEGTDDISCSSWRESPPAQLVPGTPDVYGTHDDCECACCKEEDCPVMTTHYFSSGSVAGCNSAQCRSRFYSCPDFGSHNNFGKVFAAFLDCECTCDGTKGSFATDDAEACSKTSCMDNLDICQAASSISTIFTESELVLSRGSDDGADTNVDDDGDDTEVTVIIGIVSAFTAGLIVIVAMIAYNYYKKERGYRWVSMSVEHSELPLEEILMQGGPWVKVDASTLKKLNDKKVPSPVPAEASLAAAADKNESAF
ncbi:hypothetical protein CYMTET_3644 [Cymbomonas tetramitiformis]|uniref:Uncharacterized protein n=1 Tax=Cymbomonas tetramitiformis TaxID=36881 RepID=A0AAE0LL56_9CHLO|nr:hypothetical protein CYMTET_3644 [Cymbomonas tetramitiformis]